MGREELIKAIMASDQLSYEQAAQRAQVIFNSPNAQSLVSNYQNFAQSNPDLISEVTNSYRDPVRPMAPNEFGIERATTANLPNMNYNIPNLPSYNPFSQSNMNVEDPLVDNSNTNLNTQSQSTFMQDPFSTFNLGNGIGNNPLYRDMLTYNQDVSTPNNEVLWEGAAYEPPVDKQQPEQAKNPYDILNPFMYSGGLSADYQAYTAGRMLSKENKTAGDWIGGLSAAGGAGLNVARNVFSGIANTKQSDKTRDWWMEQEMKRQYTPNRTYGDQNSTGGTAYKKGGMVKIKRNGN